MSLLRFAILSVVLAGLPGPAVTREIPPIGTESVFEHGGGCRKSSPPGQCCHMETATGRVHCH